jgi:hypothetical protein
VASKGEIYLGPSGSETLITAFGRRLIIIPEEISRSDRTASGRLVKDIVAVKYRFEMPYSAIDGDNLQDLLDCYDLKSELSLLIYLTDTTTFLNDEGETPVVLMDPLERERLLLLGEGLWTGANLVLSEV